MLIQVQYANGKYDMVKAWFLDWLIETGRIVTFKRSEGWVIIGRDTIRDTSSNVVYQGQEKRNPLQIPLLAAAVRELEIRK